MMTPLDKTYLALCLITTLLDNRRSYPTLYEMYNTDSREALHLIGGEGASRFAEWLSEDGRKVGGPDAQIDTDLAFVFLYEFDHMISLRD